MPKPLAYSLALPLADAHGLSSRYRVAVVVDRTDDKPLTAKDVAAIEAALADLTRAEPEPTEKDVHATALAAVEAAGRASKGKGKPAKAAPARPRRASKAPARKAAKRPAKRPAKG